MYEILNHSLLLPHSILSLFLSGFWFCTFLKLSHLASLITGTIRKHHCHTLLCKLATLPSSPSCRCDRFSLSPPCQKWHCSIMFLHCSTFNEIPLKNRWLIWCWIKETPWSQMWLQQVESNSHVISSSDRRVLMGSTVFEWRALYWTSPQEHYGLKAWSLLQHTMVLWWKGRMPSVS